MEQWKYNYSLNQEDFMMITIKKLIGICCFTLGIALFIPNQQAHGHYRQLVEAVNHLREAQQEANQLLHRIAPSIPASFFDWLKSRWWTGPATLAVATTAIPNDLSFLVKTFHGLLNPSACPAQNLCTTLNVGTKVIINTIKALPFIGALLIPLWAYYKLCVQGRPTHKSTITNMFLTTLAATGLFFYYKN